MKYNKGNKERELLDPAYWRRMAEEMRRESKDLTDWINAGADPDKAPARSKFLDDLDARLQAEKKAAIACIKSRQKRRPPQP